MSLSRWPVRLSVRSPGFHPGKTGSTPVPATKPSRAIGKAFLVLGIAESSLSQTDEKQKMLKANEV